MGDNTSIFPQSIFLCYPADMSYLGSLWEFDMMGITLVHLEGRLTNSSLERSG